MAVEKGTVTQVLRHPEEPLYLLVNGYLKVTPVHRVLSAGVWRHVGDLKVGDTLTDTQGKTVTITSIVPIHDAVKVYNLTTFPFHTYVAGGVIVHNVKQGGGIEDGGDCIPECP